MPYVRMRIPLVHDCELAGGKSPGSAWVVHPFLISTSLHYITPAPHKGVREIREHGLTSALGDNMVDWLAEGYGEGLLFVFLRVEHCIMRPDSRDGRLVS